MLKLLLGLDESQQLVGFDVFFNGRLILVPVFIAAAVI